MKLSKQQIRAYIKQNAATAITRRAAEYVPERVSETSTHAEYRCQGTQRKPYTIHIDWEKNLSTSCTCPYGEMYEGICKHTVAALNHLQNHLADVIDVDVTPIVSAPTQFKQNLRYQLDEQGNIPFDLIRDDFVQNFKNRVQHHFSINIDDFNPLQSRIQLSVSSYYRRSQINIFLNENQMVVQCNCDKHGKQKTPHCQVQWEALQYIKKHLGEGCLKPDYFNNQINKLLAPYGLTTADNYLTYFGVAFGKNGVELIKKAEGLQEISNFRLPETNKMPLQPTVAQTHGVGLMLEFNGKEFSHLRLVSAKLKNGELATHFRILMSYDLTGKEMFSGMYGKINTLLLLEKFVNHFNQEYAGYRKNTAHALLAWREVLANMPTQYPVYIHENGKNLSLNHLQRIELNKDFTPELSFQLFDDEHFFRLEPRIRLPENSYIFGSKNILLSPFFVIHNNQLFPIDNPTLAQDIQHYEQNPKMLFVKSQKLDFQEKVLQPLSQRYRIQSKNFVSEKTAKKSRNRQPENAHSSENTFEKQIYISEYEGWIRFQAAAQYPDKLINVNSPELRVSVNEQGEFVVRERNTLAEQAFIDEVANSHADFALADGMYFLPADELMRDFWLLYAIEKWRANGIALFGQENLKLKYNLHSPKITYHTTAQTDWFDLEIEVSFGEQQVSLADLRQAFVKKSAFVALGDGTLGVLPQDWLARFGAYFQAAEFKKNHLQIAHSQFNLIDDLYQQMEEKPQFIKDLYARKQRLAQLHEQPPTPLPEGVNAVLRPYQQHGFDWLVFLHENQMGGCLADDMGLGKTLQTIVFMQYLKFRQPESLPNLIITPTSLIFNWENELAKFCPSLRVLNYTGAQRSGSLNDFANYDVILTTYGSMVRDIDELKQQPFHYVILDESQAIKNPNSQRYKAVRLLQAWNRLALSGTPIENNVFDLYAQFNFLNPHLLGSQKHFKEQFANPIDKEHSQEVADLLSKMIQPFILRRTKEQVASELPAKTESVIFCEMGKQQRKIYESYKAKYRDFLLNKIETDGLQQSRLHILDGLLKLRQICNSPALLPNAEGDFGTESVKLDILLEQIQEHTSSHKILVFSSFVNMLQLVSERLDAANIGYAYLDGQTRKREDVVREFQENEAMRVFLISTKAGGVGLNLTQADYVFIIDPWWNPAVENQAIDRSYRIGQDKHVMAYRMICRDSIEEKILALQDKKRALASSLINVDDEQKQFDLETVRDLFA